MKEKKNENWNPVLLT